MDEPVPASDEQVRLAAAVTGGLVAQVEAGQITVLRLPDLAMVAEIGLVGAVDDNDVAFVGERARLVVLGRAGNESVLHVIDPSGPTKLGELKFRGAARIAAIAGEYVLITAGNASIIDLTKPEPSASVLPLRGAITAAGTMESRFLICIAGVLEEWDPATRKPARRLRVDQAIDPWLIGGNDSRVWIVSRRQPELLDVVNLDRRTSRRLELPEPVSRVIAHRSGEIVIAIGAESNRAHVVYVGRQHDPIVPIEQAVADVAWLGRGFTLVVRPVDGPIGLLSIPGVREEPEVTPVRTVEPPPPPAPPAELPANPGEAPPAQWTREDIAARLAAWRERVSEGARESTPEPAVRDSAASPAAMAAVTAPLPPRAPRIETDVHPGGWRGELATWARAVCARSHREMPRLDCGVLDEVAARLELVETNREALALLYGAYLNGIVHVAPIVLAPAVGWQWQEALGGGKLAASGALYWRRGQIGLYAEVIAALDERPALHGTLVASDRALATRVAIVAPATLSLAEVAAAAAPTVGALFVPVRSGRRFLLEAMVRGLAPLVRAGDALPAPGAVVVAGDSEAGALGLVVAARLA